MSKFKYEQGRSAPTIHVYSLDYDGCLDTEQSQDNFIKKVMNDCFQNRHCNAIFFGIDSLRQFIYTDIYNAANNAEAHNNKYISCSELINDLPKKIAKAIKQTFKESRAISVKTIRILNSDIYNQLETGTTLQHMTNQNCEKFLHPEKFLTPVNLDITDSETGEMVSTYTQDEFDDWLDRVNHECQIKSIDIDTYLKERGTSSEQLDNHIDYRKKFNEMFHITEINQKGEEVTLLSLDRPCTYGKENLNCGNSVHCADLSKVISLYDLVHYIRNRTEEHCRFYEFDDRLDILEDKERACEECPGFLPANTSFLAVEWNSDDDFDPTQVSSRKIIYGDSNAFVNNNFEQDIREAVLETIIPELKNEGTVHVSFKTAVNALSNIYTKVKERAAAEKAAVTLKCSANYDVAMYPKKSKFEITAGSAFSLHKSNFSFNSN